MIVNYNKVATLAQSIEKWFLACFWYVFTELTHECLPHFCSGNLVFTFLDVCFSNLRKRIGGIKHLEIS